MVLLSFAILGQRISSIGNYLKGKGRSWPWLMLPPAVDESGNIAFKYRRCGFGNKEEEEELIQRNSAGIPAESELVGSSHGWVALQSCRHLFLSNPINNQHIKLPDLASLGPANRLILSSSVSASQESPLPLAFLMTRNPRSRIAFCSPLRSKEWTLLGDGDYSYKNLAYSSKHKLLFCIRRQGHSTSMSLEGWDVAGRRAWVFQDDKALNFGDRQFWWPVMEGLKRHCTKMYYLVCAGAGDLYLVVRHVNLRVGPNGGLSLVEKVILCPDRGCLVTRSPYKTIDFDVYKVDVEGGGGGGVTHMSNSLQDLAMFVGLGHPFAIPAAEVAGLMPDSLYFTDERCLAVQAASGYGGHDNGIFDYKGKDFHPCCNFYPIDHRNVTTALPLPLWFTPSRSNYY